MPNTNSKIRSDSPDSAETCLLASPSVVTTLATSSSACVESFRPSANVKSCTPAFEDLTDEDKAVVRSKSLRLAKLAPFTPSDADDIAQELTLAWAKSQALHQPERGAIRALRKTVIERTAAKLLRKARSDKRFGTPTTSLDAVQTDSMGREIARDRRRPSLDGSGLTSQQQVDLRLDLQTLLERLPPRLSELCELLKERTIPEISRDLSIPPTTLASRVSLIRKRFQTSKFHNLL